MKLRDFDEVLFKELQDPEFAVAYLTDAIEEPADLPGLLLAIRHVIEARGGIGKFADQMGSLNRVSIYKALSENGNPLFSTVVEVLDSLGIGLKPYIRN